MGNASRVLGLLLGVLLVVGAGWVLGMRRKGSVVVRAQRRINKRLINPQQLKTAGQPGVSASVVHHRGRSSGTEYRTPVGAVPTDDGFVIGLVYGQDTDWLKNVLASGGATIVHDGVPHAVEAPEIVSFDEAVDDFPEGDRRALRVMGVQHCLRVRRTQPISA